MPSYQWRDMGRITAEDAEAEPAHERLFKEEIMLKRDENDLTGKTFGLLTVIEKADNVIHRNAFWKCRCTCGNIVYVSGTNLRMSYTTDCGCDRGTRY